MAIELAYKSLFPLLPPVQPKPGHDGHVDAVVSHVVRSGEIRIHPQTTSSMS